jgi:hypothetical protein
MVRQLLPEKTEGRQHAVPRLRVGKIAALFRDAESSQTKTCGRDAGHLFAAVAPAHVEAVSHQAGLWIALLPKEEIVGLLQFVEEPVILIGKGRLCFPGAQQGHETDTT